MVMNKFLQNLVIKMMLLILENKFRKDDIAIISRQTKDRIGFFNCSKVQGATRDGANDRCLCENAGSILSDESGKLKCYGKVHKPIHATLSLYRQTTQQILKTFPIIADCHMETISNKSHTYPIIDFGKECPTRTVLNSAVWNINTTGETRGYWLYSDDIKTFLTFSTEGKLKVNVSNGLLDGLFLKLELLCSSTNMIKCVLIKIHGIRLYPLTQFNTSTIVPTPTTTATMKSKSTATPKSRSETNTKQPISKNSTNSQKNKSIKQKSSWKNHNAIIVLLVASVTMLISSILFVYLWRQRKRKLNLREDRLKRPSQQPLEPINLQPNFPEAKRNSTKSNIYETFGDEYTSVTINPSLKSGEEKAQYNQLPPDYQEIKPVYTDLSITNSTSSEKLSYGKPEKREKKLFRSHLNILRKKVSVTLIPSPKLEEGKQQYKELAESYRDVKPVYTDLSKDKPTFEEEHLYKELEEPKRTELPRASNVINKKASVTFNPTKKSEKQIPQYSEIAPQYPDSLPVYVNPNAVGGHVYRELEEPNKTDFLSSPSVMYDKPHCVVGNYCHRVKKLSWEVLNPKLIQARVLSDGIVV